MCLVRYILVLVISIFVLSSNLAQMDSVLIKTFGGPSEDVFNDIAIDNDTLFVVGSTSICGSEDAIIMILDTNLNEISRLKFGTEEYIEKFYSIAILEDTLYVAGLINQNQSYEVGLYKYDKALNLVNSEVLNFGVWTICDQIMFNGEQIYGVGKVLNTNGDWDACIFSYSRDLVLNWYQTIGLSGNDEFYDLTIWDDSTMIAAGYQTDQNGNQKDVLITKINSNGSIKWNSIIGGSEHDWVESVIKTNDNGLAMFGTTSSYNSVSEDTYLVKTDSNGVFLWSNFHQVQSPDNVLSDNGVELLQRSNGEYYLFANLSSFVYPGVYNSAVFRADGGGYWMGTQYVCGTNNDVIIDVCRKSDSSMFYCGYTMSEGYGGKEGMIGKIPFVGTSSVVFESEEEVYGCYADVEIMELKNIRIYPNPFSNYIEIENEETISVVTIYNALGQIVLTEFIDSYQFSLSTENIIEKGLYLLELTTVHGARTVMKIIHE